MWILVAMFCSTQNAVDCDIKVWPKSYFTLEQCLAASVESQSSIPNDVAFYKLRCVSPSDQEAT
jgi:hypothetical protein